MYFDWKGALSIKETRQYRQQMKNTLVLKWGPALSTGNEHIDTQHKELFDHVNKLIDAVERHAADDSTAQIIAFLENDVDEHFTAEEALMENCAHRKDYSQAHKKEHALFRHNFAEFKKEFQTDGTSGDLCKHLEKYISSWLIDHVAYIDTKLKTHW